MIPTCIGSNPIAPAKYPSLVQWIEYRASNSGVEVRFLQDGPRKEITMKPKTFKNRMNGDKFVCDDVRLVEVIDGVEYIIVHRPNEQRTFKMRRDALEQVVEAKVKIPQ